MTRRSGWRSWMVATTLLTAFFVPLVQSPGADAAGGVEFVAVAHSDPQSQKFKDAAVPSQAQAGDTLVMVFTGATAVTWTGPGGVSGWTQVDSFGSGGLSSTIWRKTATAADPGDTVRFDTANYAKALLTVAAYRGVDAASPLTTSHSADGSATTTHLSPTATAAAGDTVASYWVDKSQTTTGWSAPGGTTSRDVVIGTGTGRFSGLLADSGGPVAGGSYGGLAAISTPSTSALKWTIALPAGSSSPPPNQPPTAAFTHGCSGRVCSFDGSVSSDPDGSVVSYAWDFGDDSTAGSASPSHTFDTAGSYQVSLVVHDDEGATDSTTSTVVVHDASSGAIAFVGAGHSDPPSQKFKEVDVPAAAGTGDTAVLVFTHATAVAWTGPSQISGWTQVNSFSASGLTSTVWRKTLVTPDLGRSVRFDTTGYAKALLTMAVYSGVDPDTALTATHASDTSRTSHVSPVVQASTDDWVLSGWADKSGTTTGWDAPAAMVTRDTAIGTGTGRFSGVLADSGSGLTAGPYGGLSAVSTPATAALMWSIVLPAGDSSPPPPPPPGDATKLMVIMEENETTGAYDSMAYLKSLSNTYGKATAFSGLVHPSEGNYIAIVSGQGVDTCGLSNPLPAACSQPGGTVFGQALAAGKTAKSYAESMNTNCQKTNSTLYAVRHNPWPYFPAESSSCSTRDVPLGTASSGALAADIDAGSLPNASMVVPNLINDAHDGTLQQADDWLALWMPRLMAGPDYQAGRLAIVITFDEGIGANQNIPFVVVHPSLSGRVVSQPFDHYGLTRMYDDILGVAPLNAAAGAPGLKAAFGL